MMPWLIFPQVMTAIEDDIFLCKIGNNVEEYVAQLLEFVSSVSGIKLVEREG